MRLLVVNVYFDPFSFGGATIVAEEMAARLFRQHGFSVTALSVRLGHLPCASVVRHSTRFGFDAFNVGMGREFCYERSYKNAAFAAECECILDSARPDVVHVHCIQNVGASFFDVLEMRNIPFVVTVHDHWWSCDRQFMIDVSGEYCSQRVVHPGVCVGRCGGSKLAIGTRLSYLRQQLNKGELVLCPSEYVRHFLADNGVEPRKLVLNKNGVLPPSTTGRQRRDGGPTVFGYVGGPGQLKGWNKIVEAFRGLDLDSLGPFEIHAVDAGELVGSSWREELLSTSGGLPVVVVPPYQQDSIDQAFAAFTALLMPSNWRETFGLTAREALLRNVWVIASDAGGLAEDIVDGENGRKLSFPPSVSELRVCIKEVLDSALPTELPHKDRIATFDDQASELAEILRSVAAGHRRTP
jgi:glycosyltransferase involved in cell wall biosynthesis